MSQSIILHVKSYRNYPTISAGFGAGVMSLLTFGSLESVPTIPMRDASADMLVDQIVLTQDFARAWHNLIGEREQIKADQKVRSQAG